MIKKFKNSIVEGGVCKMIYFGLIENDGEYRACFHQFKLLFQPRTRIYPTESEVIPRFGIQAKTPEELQETNGVSDYMYGEEEFKKNGRPIRVLEIELPDDKRVTLFALEVLKELSEMTIGGIWHVPTLDYPVELDILIGKELLFKVEVKDDRAFKFDDSFKIRRTCDDDDIIKELKNEGSIRTLEKLKLKAPVNELFNEDETHGSEFVHVVDLYNEGEMTQMISPLSVEECSSVAACLAPQKRKSGPRIGRGALAKKSVHTKVLKV
ncbi:hypothetical protein SESBI_48152 [Sesbania bispinosa]|nr:hypothetical protein SESBI_48152 [Sesbania bispinosa]